MKIGILGSGAVGVSLAKGFLAEGHQIWLATREPDSDKGRQLENDAEGATICDFSTAAKAADIAVLCVKADGLHEAVERVGAENLSNKIVIDTTNAIKTEGGVLIYAGGEKSMAEQVQGSLLESKVIKAFNTVGAATMYKPDFGDQTPTMFIAGDDTNAKKQVSDIVTMFGWESLDVGPLVLARSLESMALIWINNSMASGTPHHAFKML